MASLTNTKIKNTYVSLLKVADNGQLDAALQDITDGAGNVSGIQLNTGGDLTASGTISFGSLKDTGENITITKFVDAADGIGSNDNDTTIPTSAAVKLYVDTNITAQDLDFATDSGTGAVDLDSQTFSILGTANEIETSGTGQTVTIGLPSSITVDVTGNLTGNVSGNVTGNLTGNVSGNVTGNVTGDLTGNVTATSVLVDGVTATTQSIGDNSTKVATTAYVDAAITAENLDIAGTSGTGSVDLDSQVLTIAGTTNEIETNASGQTITVGLPSDVTIGNNLTVTTNATVGGTFGVTGATGVDGDFDVNTNKFNVQAATGNTSVAGTFGVTGNTTLSTVDVTGLASLDGGIDVDGAFTVADTTGNVSTSGTLAVTGTTTLTDDLAVDTDTLFVDASADRVGINKNNPAVALDVVGDITSSATITGTTLAGTLSTAAQPNITSVGTLSSLAVSGNLTVDTNTLYVDAANNKVGIGTTSLSTFDVLRVTGSNAVANDLVLATPNTAQSRIFFSDTDAEGVGELGYDHASNAMRIVTNGSEKLRIDSSGNVGIGTSSPSYKLQVDHTSGYSLRLPYTSENLEMYMGTVTGGKIGIQAKVINSGNSYPLYLNPEGGNVVINSGNLSFANGSGIDFSASAGGGATSSLLDDYEEGTWTPVLSDLTNNFTPDAGTTGFYTKIGRMVYLNFTVYATSLGSVSGNIYITGFPFTGSNQSSPVGIVTSSANQFLNVTSGQFVSGRILGNTSRVELWLNDSAAGMTNMQASEWSADGYAHFLGYYFV